MNPFFFFLVKIGNTANHALKLHVLEGFTEVFIFAVNISLE